MKKELTVQVTSKRPCVCCSQLSGTNWAYVDHVQAKLYPSPSPPPFVFKSLTRDPKGAGVEGGGGAVGHLLPPTLRLNSPTALIHQLCQRHLSHLMGHPSLERTLLLEPQSQRCPASQQRSFGGGGGYQGEEVKPAGGGEGEERALALFLHTFGMHVDFSSSYLRFAEAVFFDIKKSFVGAIHLVMVI